MRDFKNPQLKAYLNTSAPPVVSHDFPGTIDIQFNSDLLHFISCKPLSSFKILYHYAFRHINMFNDPHIVIHNLLIHSIKVNMPKKVGFILNHINSIASQENEESKLWNTFADMKTEYGRTALMIAVSLYKLDIVQCLLSHGANPSCTSFSGISDFNHVGFSGFTYSDFSTPSCLNQRLGI